MSCVFCAIATGSAPSSWVAREDKAVAFLDMHPLFRGHVLIVPTTHVVTLPELPVDELVPLFSLVQRVAAALGPALGAEGSFVAVNNLVSQSVPHLHVHVVPRKKGDGLRGFFWPRQKYADDAERDDYARRIREQLKT